MNTNAELPKWNPSRLVLASAIAVTLALAMPGCQTSPHERGVLTDEHSEVGASGPVKTGAQLWAENCNRCHNFRSPGSYNDTQWEVAMHHMRIRGNLTAEEHRKILAFLQSAN